ncbi:MAG TPA: spore germination lipoprotein GerD [Chondromyces sp.]|nr:spore germination lipoprotein GerD [Chondromyces sp.]
MKKLMLPLLLSLFSLSACGGGGETEVNAQMDYDETKKMVVDILKTDDGKKAIQETMKDEAVKQQLIMDQKVVTDTIQTTLTSEKGRDFWKEAYKDPAFAEAVAKSMKDQNSQLLKDLMKDPEYREMMLSVMKDPEYEKNTIELLKSKEYKEHLQKTMGESLDSPLFKTKVEDMITKAATEQQKQQGKKEEG